MSKLGLQAQLIQVGKASANAALRLIGSLNEVTKAYLFISAGGYTPRVQVALPFNRDDR